MDGRFLGQADAATVEARGLDEMSSPQPQDTDYTDSIRLPKWREGKVRPIPGSPPHDRLVGRGFFSSLGWLATIPSTPLRYGGSPHQRGLDRAFMRHRGIYRSDRAGLLKTWPGVPPPVGRARARPLQSATGGARPAYRPR